MNRIAIVLLAVVVFALAATPAFAQRFRVSTSARPTTVNKPVEAHYSSSSSSSHGGHYSASSSDYSSNDSGDSGVNFQMVGTVVVLLALAIRIICGVIGLFVWVGRGIVG